MNLNKLYQEFPPKKRPDFKLLGIAIWLVVFGIMMIISSSNVIGFHQFNQSFYFVTRHIMFILIGIIAFLITFIIPHQFIRKFSWYIWSISIVLALMTYMPNIGITVGGSSRWIRFLGFTFQPSEIVKFSIILLVADYLDKNKDKLNSNIQTLGFLLAIIAFSSLIILKQPDLGTTVIIMISFLAQAFVAGIKIEWIFGLLGIGALSTLLSIVARPYQLARVQAFLNPWSDQFGKGFHIIQSLIAIGTGGLLGLGIGQSRQKFFYLPQQYTDFIYSIISEELGFFITLVLFLFPMIIFYTKCFLIAVRQNNLFSKLLIVGITSWLSFQSIINISVALNLLPTTGITLPFISFGGTSIVMTLAMTGIIMNASRYQERL
jgi:cell division protein FtsW